MLYRHLVGRDFYVILYSLLEGFWKYLIMFDYGFGGNNFWSFYVFDG